MNEIQIIDKETIWYKKVRNGLWCVYRDNKKISEHSMENGAQMACKLFLSTPKADVI